MKNRSQLSERKPLNPPDQAHPWLEEKVYAKKRERTVALVKQSVDALCKDKQRVSLATVATKSRELDVEHRGISESAILDNQEARTYYEQHRTFQGKRRRKVQPLTVALSAPVGPVKLDRNEQRARQRYLRMSKEVLVEQLLAVERLSAQERERWLTQQDEVLTWRLCAETAETQLKEGRRL